MDTPSPVTSRSASCAGSSRGSACRGRTGGFAPDVGPARRGGDMYKRILVGLDGSSHGLRTAEAAAELAAAFDAELHLLTVTRAYEVSSEVQGYLEAENLLGEPRYVLDEETQATVDRAKA